MARRKAVQTRSLTRTMGVFLLVLQVLSVVSLGVIVYLLYTSEPIREISGTEFGIYIAIGCVGLLVGFILTSTKNKHLAGWILSGSAFLIGGAAIGLISKLNPLLLPITFFAINCLAGLWWNLRKDHSGPAVPITASIFLIMSFTLTNLCLYKVLEPGHYQIDHSPHVGDWIWYSLSHLLRSGDVLDILHQYEIDLRNVEHNSTLTGVVLVLFYAATGANLTLWFGRFLSRVLTNRRAGTSPSSGTRLTRRTALLCCGAALFLAIGLAIAQEWSLREWWLWVIDNVVRLIDIADVMNIFHWRLDETPNTMLVATAAILFRLGIGLYLAAKLTEWSVNYFGGLGLGPADLLKLFRENPEQSREILAILSRYNAESLRWQSREIAITFSGCDNAKSRASLLAIVARLCRLKGGVPSQRSQAAQPKPPAQVHAEVLLGVLSEAVFDPDPEVSRIAVEELQLLGREQQLLSALADSLKADAASHSQSSRILLALHHLRELKQDASEATSAVLALATNRERPHEMRIEAAKTLRAINPDEYTRRLKKKF